MVDVPVGDDQLQHVEIARDIINRFNLRYNVSFNLPEAEICEGSRIMSLSDGTKKMSKSSQSQYSNITIIGTWRVLRDHQTPQSAFSSALSAPRQTASPASRSPEQGHQQ